MFRIDNATAVPAAPAAPGPSTPGYFTNGNPPSAVAATIVDDWWLNQLQEEILTVVTRAGLDPDKTDTTQLYQAILKLLPRERLNAPFTVYVAPGGSDTTGDGSSGNPFASLQRAFNFANSTFDFAGTQITIQLADGTYTAALVAAGAATGATVATPIIIQGNAANPANVVIHVTGLNCITAQNGAGLMVQNLTLISTVSASSGGAGLVAVNGGVLMFQNLVFGACGFAHSFATQGGQIIAAGPYTISGGAPSHFVGSSGGYGQMSGVGGGSSAIVVTLTGTPAFPNGFAVVQNSTLLAPLNTFSGGATGPRYAASINGVIDTNGNSATYFPGNAAGTPVPNTLGPTGGLYI